MTCGRHGMEALIVTHHLAPTELAGTQINTEESKTKAALADGQAILYEKSTSMHVRNYANNDIKKAKQRYFTTNLPNAQTNTRKKIRKLTNKLATLQ